MIFLSPEAYKQIEDLKKKIQAQILKIAKDAYVLNSDDFQICFELHGYVHVIKLDVFLGGTNKDYSNQTVILDCYTQPFYYDSLSPAFWQKILDDLIASQKKLRELKKLQIAEAKNLEAV